MRVRAVCDTGLHCAAATPIVGETCGRSQGTPSGSASCTDINDPCDDGNNCSTDECDIGQQLCRHVAQASCCLAHTDCLDGAQCTTDVCDLDFNSCSNDPISNCCTADAECDDSDDCTADYCVAMQCRHFAVANCCLSDADCVAGNECLVGTCDVGQNSCSYAPDYSNPSVECCSTAGDCYDGLPCTNDSCVDHPSQHSPIVPCCTDQNEAENCNDYDPCTADDCIGGVCHNLPPDQAPPEFGIPPLCCVVDGDCSDDYDDCTTDACVDGLCAYTPDAVCVLPLPHLQRFAKCGALETMHWSLDDQGTATDENWECSTSGPLGPDMHLGFFWAPQVLNFDSYLVSPEFAVAGYAYVTVQLDRFYDHYEDMVDLGLYVSESGPPFVPEDALWAETVSDDLLQDTVEYELTAPAANVVFGVRVSAPDSYDLDEFAIDNFRVCEGRAPQFGEAIEPQVVFVSNPDTVGLTVDDPDLADTITFILESAPSFVSLENQQNLAPQHTIDLVIDPASAANAGTHAAVVRVTDGCLVDYLTIDITVYETGGYIIWVPEELDEGDFALAIKDAIEAAGRSAQTIPDLSIIPEFIDLEGVFAPLGIYGNKHVLTADESLELETYLDAGGRLYLEGGDTFFVDPYQAVLSYCEIQGILDGPQELTGQVEGRHFCWGLDLDLSSSYAVNNFLDAVETLYGVEIGEVSNHGTTAAAHEDVSGYRTIASSVPLAALLETGSHAPADLMGLYLDFLESGWPACENDSQCADDRVCTGPDTCVAGACDNSQLPGCIPCWDDTFCPADEACVPEGKCLAIPGQPWPSTDTPLWFGDEPDEIHSTITVPEEDHDNYVADVNVKVSVSHQYVGDLRLELCHAAQCVVLKEEDPTDSSWHLDATYDLGVDPDLDSMSDLDGTLAHGDWVLSAYDMYPGLSDGQLLDWSVHIVEFNCGGDEDCDDSDPCSDEVCEPTQGCVFTPNVGGPCEDSSLCTEADYCSDWYCIPGTTVDCDDANVCTDDTCIPETGCQHDDNTDPCDDGDPCTTGDVCQAGDCTPGGQTDCDDGNPCTDDSCDPGLGCVNAAVADDTPCDNGNPCTQDDACSGGSCAAGRPVICDSANPCEIVLCDPDDGCAVPPTSLPAGVPCNVQTHPCGLYSCDGLGQCMLAQAMAEGSLCRPEGEMNPCLAYWCSGGVCEPQPDAVAPDGTACETNCGAGTCTAGACNLSSHAPAGPLCAGPGARVQGGGKAFANPVQAHQHQRDGHHLEAGRRGPRDAARTQIRAGPGHARAAGPSGGAPGGPREELRRALRRRVRCPGQGRQDAAGGGRQGSGEALHGRRVHRHRGRGVDRDSRHRQR